MNLLLLILLYLLLAQHVSSFFLRGLPLRQVNTQMQIDKKSLTSKPLVRIHRPLVLKSSSDASDADEMFVSGYEIDDYEDEADDEKEYDDDDDDDILFDGVWIDDDENATRDASSYIDSIAVSPTTPYMVSVPNISYFYLRDTIGVPEHVLLGKISYEAPSILGITAKVIAHKCKVLTDILQLSYPELADIISRHPQILQLSADKNISPTILFLQRTLNLSRAELRRLITQCPSLLSYRLLNLQHKYLFFVEAMGYTTDETRKILLTEPRLLQCSVETGLLPRLKFWQSEVNMSTETLQKFVLKYPRALALSIHENLVPKVIYYFVMTLHMNMTDIHKLLLSYPQLLDYNLERHILPITRYFVKELGFGTIPADKSKSKRGVSKQYELRKLVLYFPRIFTYSLANIKHVVGYMRYELGLTGEQTRHVIAKAPQVVGLNTDLTLAGKVTYLRERLQLRHNDELCKLIASMPSLLLYSVDKNLEPKITYIESKLGNLTQTAVLHQPALLAYSLEKRIRPRLEAIESVLYSNIDVPVDRLLKDIMTSMTMTNANFILWLKRQQKRKAVPLLPLSRVASLPAAKGQLVISTVGKGEDDRIMHWTRDDDV